MTFCFIDYFCLENKCVCYKKLKLQKDIQCKEGLPQLFPRHTVPLLEATAISNSCVNLTQNYSKFIVSFNGHLSGYRYKNVLQLR